VPGCVAKPVPRGLYVGGVVARAMFLRKNAFLVEIFVDVPSTTTWTKNEMPRRTTRGRRGAAGCGGAGGWGSRETWGNGLRLQQL
jgi:hypothetical protein